MCELSDYLGQSFFQCYKLYCRKNSLFWMIFRYYKFFLTSPLRQAQQNLYDEALIEFITGMRLRQ